MSQTYRVTGLSEQHLRVLVRALDFMGRMGLGQFKEVMGVADPAFKVGGDERAIAEKLLMQARSLLMPGLEATNAYWSIRSPQVSDDLRVAFDLQQVIRHRLAWDGNPKGDFTVDFDEPWRTSERVGLVRMEKESDELPPPPDEIIVPVEMLSGVKAPKKASKKPTGKHHIPPTAKRDMVVGDGKARISSLQLPLCEVKVACDGNRLMGTRKVCGKCEEALAKKAKRDGKAPVLKGVPSRTNKRRTT